MQSTKLSNTRLKLSNGNTRLGTLELGKNYDDTGSLSRGESKVYRFRIGANSGDNALTVDTQVKGSLATIALLDRQGNSPTTTGISTNVSADSDGGNNNGRILTTFTGIAPGAYSLRLQGAGAGNNTYSLRLKYQPAQANNGATDFSNLSDRLNSDRFNIDFDRFSSQVSSVDFNPSR